MSADDVAFAIGLRLGEIERIEDGRALPSVNVLAHLRDVLGADLNEIIGVAVPLGRLRMAGPGFGGRVTFGFIDKLGGEDAVRRIVKPVRGKLRAQAIQNWHERRRVPHYAIHQMLAYAAENGIKLSHEDFIPQRLKRDGSTEWPAATLVGGSAGTFTPVRRSYPA
jgi:transcriptional regulator with XRE-family HTH domain